MGAGATTMGSTGAVFTPPAWAAPAISAPAAVMVTNFMGSAPCGFLIRHAA